MYTVLHIFRQVLFGAGNQGNHKNFDLSCMYFKKTTILSNMQFLSPYFVVTKVQIANQQMHLASMNMQMKALMGFIYTFYITCDIKPALDYKPLLNTNHT